MVLPLAASRRSPLRPLACALTLLACTAPAALLAQIPPDELPLGPFQVSVIETGDFTRQVLVDGKVLLEDEQVLLDESYEIGGIPVVTGVSGAGGNACNATPFVISLQEGAAQLAGPIESCLWFETEAGAEGLTFRTGALPGSPAEVWHWTPAEGLSEDSPEGFTPNASETWEDFATLAGMHPIDALSFAPVFTELKARLSEADWQSYTAILAGLGSGEMSEQGYRGSACTKFICEEEWAWLWIDPASRQPVALWKGAEEEEPRSWPADRSSWPEWIQLDAAQVLEGAG